MTGYRVNWEIDTESETPIKAAQEAFAAMQRQGTTATVFDVLEHDGEAVRVDLMEVGTVDLAPAKATCPPDMQPSNNERASWANDSLSTFVNEVGDSGDMEANLSDLLCDFRHLADAQVWDIEAMWAGSRGTYREEIAEQSKADSTFAEKENDATI